MSSVKQILYLETEQESTAHLVDLQGRKILPSKSGSSLLFNLEELEIGLYVLIVKFDNRTVISVEKMLRNPSQLLESSSKRWEISPPCCRYKTIPKEFEMK